MKPGARLTLSVEAPDEHGAGLALHGNTQVHVAGSLPGETVRAVVEHVSVHRSAGVNRAWASLSRVVSASSERVEPVCPAYGQCGGCPLQHWSYPAQTAWKRDRVAESVAQQPALARVHVESCVPSPVSLGYRNQGKYVYGIDEEGYLSLGAFAPRSHRLIDLQGCRLVEPAIDRVVSQLLPLLVAQEVEPYDEGHRTGRLRYVIVRSNDRGQCLVTFITAVHDFAEGKQLAEALRAAEPSVIGVVQNVNTTTGNVLFGDLEILLSGSDRLEDRVEGARVFLSSRAFFQVNRSVASLAYRAIHAAARRLGPDLRIIDAYAGVGGITLGLAGLAREVIAIEENPAATTDGALAAREAGLHQVRFITADTAEGLGRLQSADLVVLNPPRSGCSEAALQAVARLRPRLIAYLSCYPETLVRNLAFLADLGYRTRRLTPFDMLPHTSHVETLALIEPA